MSKLTVIILMTLNFVLSASSGIYHVGSKITFHPDQPADYFGYAVELSELGLIVGAPKAKNRLKPWITSGVVFNCSLDNLQVQERGCYPLNFDDDREIARSTSRDFFRNDMWFGATIATVPNRKLFICAPRWSVPYRDTHILANGACYVQTVSRGTSLLPLRERSNQAFVIPNDLKRNYGPKGSHLNYYAYGQAGMSVKVAGNDTVIIGAPGLLHWTGTINMKITGGRWSKTGKGGGISERAMSSIGLLQTENDNMVNTKGGYVEFKHDTNINSVFFSKQEIMNPFFTNDFNLDEYLGYSMEAGVFEPDGRNLYVAGAPRSKSGYGQVFIFEPASREAAPLKIRAKIHGPHLGSYFGASLSCLDINGDGRPDLLVGAPSFVKEHAGMPYEQGAVFIYLTKYENHTFSLISAGHVTGSEASGARFGHSIADLGDIDDDGYRDVAIGAPWENQNSGVVYIYRGCSNGLRNTYAQRIMAESSQSFGWSISKGFDVDNNRCNDIAVGSFNSSTVHLYRCVPTIHVMVSIKIPDAMDLPQNATNFTALFCIEAPHKKLWSHLKIYLKATIIVDREEQRAQISGDSQYETEVQPGNDICDQQTVEVKPTADLSKPISIKFNLEAVRVLQDSSSNFSSYAARLSEDSVLNSSFDIQLTRDCGEDLICFPYLELTLDPWFNPYIPGTNSTLGATITVMNKEEPAYGAKVNITLPLPPLRVPTPCVLLELNMTCKLPAPLHRGETVTYDIELDQTLRNVDNTELIVSALIFDSLYKRNISDNEIKKLVINVTPEANFSISGKALPNITVLVTREKLNEGSVVSCVHYFEVTNHGPSDWPRLTTRLELSNRVNFSTQYKDCDTYDSNNTTIFTCTGPIAVNVSKPIVLQLRFDLRLYGESLEKDNELNITTTITLISQNQYKNVSVTTTLVLESAPPIWPLVLGLVTGLIVLSVVIYVLYRCGFFSRQRREDLKRLKRETLLEEETGSSEVFPKEGDCVQDSTHDLVSDASE